MLFVLICKDKPNSSRMEHRDAHLAYVKETGKVQIAGPFLAADGETMTGSLIVLEAESMEEAKAWSAKDPYVLGDVFESVGVLPWKRTI